MAIAVPFCKTVRLDCLPVNELMAALVTNGAAMSLR